MIFGKHNLSTTEKLSAEPLEKVLDTCVQLT